MNSITNKHYSKSTTKPKNLDFNKSKKIFDINQITNFEFNQYFSSLAIITLQLNVHIIDCMTRNERHKFSLYDVLDEDIEHVKNSLFQEEGDIQLKFSKNTNFMMIYFRQLNQLYMMQLKNNQIVKVGSLKLQEKLYNFQPDPTNKNMFIANAINNSKFYYFKKSDFVYQVYPFNENIDDNKNGQQQQNQKQIPSINQNYSMTQLPLNKNLGGLNICTLNNIDQEILNERYQQENILGIKKQNILSCVQLNQNDSAKDIFNTSNQKEKDYIEKMYSDMDLNSSLNSNAKDKQDKQQHFISSLSKIDSLQLQKAQSSPYIPLLNKQYSNQEFLLAHNSQKSSPQKNLGDILQNQNEQQSNNLNQFQLEKKENSYQNKRIVDINVNSEKKESFDLNNQNNLEQNKEELEHVNQENQKNIQQNQLLVEEENVQQQQMNLQIGIGNSNSREQISEDFDKGPTKKQKINLEQDDKQPQEENKNINNSIQNDNIESNKYSQKINSAREMEQEETIIKGSDQLNFKEINADTGENLDSQDNNISYESQEKIEYKKEMSSVSEEYQENIESQSENRQDQYQSENQDQDDNENDGDYREQIIKNTTELDQKNTYDKQNQSLNQNYNQNQSQSNKKDSKKIFKENQSFVYSEYIKCKCTKEVKYLIIIHKYIVSVLKVSLQQDFKNQIKNNGISKFEKNSYLDSQYDKIQFLENQVQNQQVSETQLQKEQIKDFSQIGQIQENVQRQNILQQQKQEDNNGFQKNCKSNYQQQQQFTQNTQLLDDSDFQQNQNLTHQFIRPQRYESTFTGQKSDINNQNGFRIVSDNSEQYDQSIDQNTDNFNEEQIEQYTIKQKNIIHQQINQFEQSRDNEIQIQQIYSIDLQDELQNIKFENLNLHKVCLDIDCSRFMLNYSKKAVIIGQINPDLSLQLYDSQFQLYNTSKTYYECIFWNCKGILESENISDYAVLVKKTNLSPQINFLNLKNGEQKQVIIDKLEPLKILFNPRWEGSITVLNQNVLINLDLKQDYYWANIAFKFIGLENNEEYIEQENEFDEKFPKENPQITDKDFEDEMSFQTYIYPEKKFDLLQIDLSLDYYGQFSV